MSKKRLSSPRSNAARRRLSGRKKIVSAIPCLRFIGVSLLGGKSDRTCVAVLEYFPDHGKLFLHQLFEKIHGNAECNADSELVRIITEFAPNIDLVAFDVPLQLPKCMRCKLKCPGAENCKTTELTYMRELNKKTLKENKNAKPITPYTQRSVELYIQRKLERPYHLQDALGANLAPLAARAEYILKRLSFPTVEVFPELSFSRIAEQIKIPQKYIKQEIRSFEQDESRQVFLQTLLEKKLCFIYQQDIQRLIDNPDAFDAFLCAFTAFLSRVGECEDRPSAFPKNELWIQFPKTEISWPNLFRDLPLEK
jgi:hypothetical protein